MALTHWGFIYTASGADQTRDRSVAQTEGCTTVLVGVEDPADGVKIAKDLVKEGVQLIELCGGFGPVHAARIIEAIEQAVPVGVVGYGPEAIDQVHAIFA